MQVHKRVPLDGQDDAGDFLLLPLGGEADRVAPAVQVAVHLHDGAKVSLKLRLHRYREVLRPKGVQINSVPTF